MNHIVLDPDKLATAVAQVLSKGSLQPEDIATAVEACPTLAPLVGKKGQSQVPQ